MRERGGSRWHACGCLVLVHRRASDDGHVLGTPVAIGGAPTGWLAVVSRRAAPSPRLARQAARATAPVLAALSRIDSLTREQQRAVRAALLDEMLEPHALRGRAAIAARAGSLGIDFAIPARVVLICPRRDAAPADADDGLAQALDALTEALAERSVASLSTRRQRAVTALVQAPHDDLRAELVQLTGRACRGSSSASDALASDIGAVVESHRDATIAVQRLDVVSAGRRILDFEDFDLVTLMISASPRRRIQPKVRRDHERTEPGGPRSTRGLLRPRPRHHERGAGNAPAPSTLRYRLGRAEEALGRSLKDPGTIAALYIALATEQVDAVGAD